MPETTQAQARTGLKRFSIRIRTRRETAVATCIARDQAQAWTTAFDLAERLLGDVPPPHLIAVRAA